MECYLEEFKGEKMLVKKILSSLVVAGLLTTVSLANSQSAPMMDKPSRNNFV